MQLFYHEVRGGEGKFGTGPLKVDGPGFKSSLMNYWGTFGFLTSSSLGLKYGILRILCILSVYASACHPHMSTLYSVRADGNKGGAWHLVGK